MDKLKTLIGRKIEVMYEENGENKSRIDIVKDVIKNDDGTYNLVFLGEIKKSL